MAPIARLHPASATLPTANIARIGHHRQSRWYVETTVARCDEQLLLGVPIVGATRRQLNFFGRASGRSCRTYPLWDRLLWQSSIRRALSTPRRNDRGSIRLHVPIDASVDVTDAHNAPSDNRLHCRRSVPRQPNGGYQLPPRHDLRNHSPDGLKWGYAGSGPAQLALAVLPDALGSDRHALDHITKRLNGRPSHRSKATSGR